MKNTTKMEIVGFVLIWLALPFAFINEGVAIIVLVMGIGLFTAGAILAFAILIRAMPHIPTIPANKEGE